MALRFTHSVSVSVYGIRCDVELNGQHSVRHGQHGAITLIVVVLLLLLVGAALSVVLSISGSGSAGASAQEDSIAALLLAESGLERASKRWANGVLCADLAEAEIPFARGSFVIQAAELVANACRIRVLGKVNNSARMVLGDATTPLFEPFPGANSLAGWPEVVLQKKGLSKFDAAASALGDNTGSLVIQTNPGNNNKFEAYRRRTLSFGITGPEVVTLNLNYKKYFTPASVIPAEQTLAVRLIDSTGGVNDVAVFNEISNANVWLRSPTFSFAVPKGAVIEKLELYYKLKNGNGKNSLPPQTLIWVDNVRLTTSAAAHPLKTWTEIAK